MRWDETFFRYPPVQNCLSVQTHWTHQWRLSMLQGCFSPSKLAPYVKANTITWITHSACPLGKKSFTFKSSNSDLLLSFEAIAGFAEISLSALLIFCPATVHCLRPVCILPPQQQCHVAETYMSISNVQSRQEQIGCRQCLCVLLLWSEPFTKRIVPVI